MRYSYYYRSARSASPEISYHHGAKTMAEHVDNLITQSRAHSEASHQLNTFGTNMGIYLHHFACYYQFNFNRVVRFHYRIRQMMFTWKSR